jgi:hypothetical protein
LSMKKIIKSVLVVFVATFLVACGVSTADYDKVVANRDELYVKWVTEAKLLEKAKLDFATEIKAKQAHAVREEQVKQRLKQAERDLAAALREISVYKGKKK